jgi:cation-transporting ATPase E
MTIGSPIQGLSERDVAARRSQGRGNDIDFATSRSYGEILRENLFTFFNIVLFGLGILLVLLGKPTEAIITSGVVSVNVIIAVVQEARAKRKLDQIALLTRPKARVIREGQEREVDPSEIVLGDVLVAGPGDQIVVDGEVIGDGRMDVDESLLTGESDLIPKRVGDTVYSGSFCVVGRATYEAQMVGAEGYAARLTAGARKFAREYTPLQREVNLFIRVLLAVVAVFGALLIISAILEEAPLLESVRAVSVLFGLAPNSLFLMIVVAYALGALRIADKGALVQQANSVESLCNVTILCLDKTGTLTANRIHLDDLQLLEGWSPGFSEPELRRVLGDYVRSASTGSRTSEAIAEACDGQARPVHEEVPFSSQRMWSGLSFAQPGVRGVYILGAPEVVRPHLALDAGPSSDARQAVTTYTARQTARGLRVLLFAYQPKLTSLHNASGQPQLPTDLIPLCLLTFGDELRPEARETLKGFVDVGIELKVISGDSPRTVAALAKQAGLGAEDLPLTVISGPELAEMDDVHFSQAALHTTIFGRITPQQKEKLIRTLRDQDQYVAMTGDGVNDVLALKQANLGIAMQSGSQATRSVADIVLLNNSFAALPDAFAEGQRILNGMQDVLKLYMTRILCLAVLIAAMGFVGIGFPFTPKQNSILSIVVLSIPAFALALWARPGPVRKGSVTRKLMHFVLPAVMASSAAGLAVYLYFLLTTQDIVYAQHTLTYAMMAMGLLLVVFAEPPTKAWVGGDELSGDWRPTWLAIGLLLAFVAFVAIPPLRSVYGLALLRQPSDYVLIAVGVILWAFALRYTWRARLLERYLHVDLGGPDGF